MNIGMCWRCLIIWSAKFRPIIEVKLPTVWTDEKAEVGRVREEKRRGEKRREEKSRQEARRSEKRKTQKKDDSVFPMMCASGGSKSRLAKAAGAEPSGQMRDEKLHAVVAQSTLRSQSVQNTSASEHF